MTQSSDSPIESTKELHESKERKPEPSEHARKLVANHETVAREYRHWGATELGDAEDAVLDYIASLEARVGLSRGAEPENLIPEKSNEELLSIARDTRRKLGAPRGEAETPTEEDKFFAWIMRRMLAESLPVERARWRVLLAAFLDATRTEPRPEQERRPDRPQWDIVTLRSALENWGWHHDWCDFGNPTPCNCGYLTALEIGKYATENPNAD